MTDRYRFGYPAVHPRILTRELKCAILGSDKNGRQASRVGLTPALVQAGRRWLAITHGR
jgi:hypothetical protein